MNPNSNPIGLSPAQNSALYHFKAIHAAELTDEIRKAIHRAKHEWEFTLPELVGALEQVKLEIWHAHAEAQLMEELQKVVPPPDLPGDEWKTPPQDGHEGIPEDEDDTEGGSPPLVPVK